MIQTFDLSVQAGEFSLSGVNLVVPSQAYCVLMGQTGSGKTTLLEAICGLKRVIGGRIELCGRDVTQLKPAERGIGLVPQDGALFQTMTVRRHLQFALEIRRAPTAAIRARVEELAALLKIESLLDRYPTNLSGGERQRVALGRALSFSPKILCLDEPLSALDDQTRQEMVDLLKLVQRQTGVTTLHVTHNQEEARQLADVGWLIAAGELEPLELEEVPETSSSSYTS